MMQRLAPWRNRSQRCVLLTRGAARLLLPLALGPVGPALTLAVTLASALLVAIVLARIVTPGAWRESAMMLHRALNASHCG